ncbi:cellular tumor antigen p53 isoform X2 [Anabrus simplex]|uniref:cellular tumor antigen p53 isoform X2 n=1 Tax=Anabrus simplex TaxID=316456 RepID=UPI0035A2D90D
MDRSDSGMSQNSLLSEGTLREVVDYVGDNNIEDVLKDVDIFSPHSELEFSRPMMIPNLPEDSAVSTLQSLPEVSRVPGPSPTCKVPCLNEYSGPYDFQFEVRNESSDRTKWQFSTLLNKLFVNMFTKISVNFKWIWQEPDLFIRALPVYTNQEYLEHPVLRCPRHSSPVESSNKGFQHLLHIIRSDHELTQYHEDPESHRLSIVVPVGGPSPGTDYARVDFTFTCKNSCPVGMNRRSTAIIFTLERSNGEVIGRQVMQLRICSCPKRDKEKEEADFRSRVEKHLPSNREFEINETPSERSVTDRPGNPRIWENPDGETYSMVWSKDRAADLAKYAYFLTLQKAGEEKRSLSKKTCMGRQEKERSNHNNHITCIDGRGVTTNCSKI